MSITSDRPLRIGYVLKKYPRLSETFILNEILGMERAGHEIDITSLTPADEGRFHADLASVRAPVRYLPPFGSALAMAAFEEMSRVPEGALRRALDYVSLLPAEKRPLTLTHALAVRKAAREKRLDHLHAHFATVAAHVVATCRLLGGPSFTVTAHAKDIYRESVDARLFQATAAASAAIITVCEANRDWILAKLLNGDESKIRVVYNGLPLDGVGPGSGPRAPATILGVGRLVEKKGFPILIDAIHRLRDSGRAVRCDIIGDGEDRSNIEAAISKWHVGDCVSLLGPLPRQEVIHRMQAATVLAAPCLTGVDGNRDALPTVLIEALACGLPSVSTPVGGIAEIIEHGIHGFIVPEQDAAALAAAIARILNEPETARAMRAAGPLRAKARFDRESTLPTLIKIMRHASNA